MNDTTLTERPGVPPPAELPTPETIDVEAIYKAWQDGEIDLVCVLGPTASGKTRYAVNLVRQLNDIALSHLPISRLHRRIYLRPRLQYASHRSFYA